MPRRKTDVFWVEQIRTLVANDRKMSTRQIEDALKATAGKLGRVDYPSPRTIDNLRKAPEEELKQYLHTRWPESFEAGLLPWADAPAVLELLRLYEDNAWGTPTVRKARWFVHVTQAAPEAPVALREELAALLAASEAAGEAADLTVNRAVQGVLLYKPWEAPESYEKAVADGRYPHIKDVHLYAGAGTLELLQRLVRDMASPEAAQRMFRNHVVPPENPVSEHAQPRGEKEVVRYGIDEYDLGLQTYVPHKRVYTTRERAVAAAPKDALWRLVEVTKGRRHPLSIERS